MFQIKQRTTSLSLNEQDQRIANELLVKFQEKFNCNSVTFKDFFLEILQISLSTQSENMKSESDFATEIEALQLENNSLKSDVEKLTSANNDLSKNLEELHENPNEVQVERQLSENEILLKLNDSQLKTVETISNNRYEFAKKRAMEFEKESVPEVIMNSFFNQANIFNWHGNFYTGL